MRKTTAAVSALALSALVLTGCSTAPGSGAAGCERSESAALSMAVKASGDIGAAKVSLTAPMPTSKVVYDDLVVGGQAFTEYPEAMAHVEAAYKARSVLPPRDIRMTAFGNRVQEAGAGIVSLAGLYADPVSAMRRAQPPAAAFDVASETSA